MSIISVENVLVEKDVTTACFRCNLGLCHGACCVEGELGAPLKTEEVAALEDGVELLRDRLPEKNLRYIRRYGCIEVYQGDIYTRTIDGGECVFAVKNGTTTLCAIEEAMLDGVNIARKPLSCRLFPIRVRKKFGLDYLVYEQHYMCRHARKEGTQNSVLLVDFLKDVLEDAYGTSFYNRLKDF
ncbi:conserved hypothetical protein [Prosthecochloris aestuarii DSM 271]|uniref:DUF3109 family protein n=1 Tax=Prosthecochloris aestuarii (strain DSM 271 / SK 413) TaxID=290512 RepID=B4S819_PROA2|nr:DUF3109 family protein [Prosthecochloris aestuarii]ACF46206.1 conserved hypothetical protein [Prosthecochloris aestuarii DSM 271]